jgi:hypothetical protein
VTDSISPKAYREGYAPDPFVFEERNDSGDVRFVAWTPDVARLKRLVYAILDMFPDRVEVLFKTETGAESGRDGWQRYSAESTRTAIVEATRDSEELIFHDGGSMLCVKRMDDGAYLALDEHATLFIYSDDRTYLTVCEQLGFENRVTELVSDAPHWHHRPAHCEEHEQRFIRRLALASVA